MTAPNPRSPWRGFDPTVRAMEPYTHLKADRRLYAGMLAAMDEAIGQIVGALEKKSLRDRTLIFFCSDNGGPKPGVVTSNGPLRGSKGTLYEGGVRVPAVAAWTGKIKPGSIVDAPLHMVDWYATLLKLAGVSLAQKHPLDGRDAWPAIAQGASSPHEDILHNITSNGGAIRAGDWKLIVGGQSSEVDGGEAGTAAKGGRKTAGESEAGQRIELFNIKNDPNEKTNLADKNPKKVAELRARLDAYAKVAVPSKLAPAAPGFKSPRVWGERDPSP
ncbi:MAG: sulfatase-like hydrolase/transferase [Opitutaceae bacterium]